MSRQLIESIIAGDMIEANDMVEATLAQIRERKLYEMKRMFAAKMDEVFGGLSPEEIAIRKKAGYRKAADVLGDPRDQRKKKIPLPDMKKEKKISEEALDENLGYGAKIAHAFTPDQKSTFRKAMATRRWSRALGKDSASAPKKDGIIQRIKKKIADHEPEAPGTAVLKSAKNVAASPVFKDLRDLGSRNL